MKVPEMTIATTVTAASATSVTLTPTVDRWDKSEGGVITTLTIAGTGLAGYTVGDRVRVRVNG